MASNSEAWNRYSYNSWGSVDGSSARVLEPEYIPQEQVFERPQRSVSRPKGQPRVFARLMLFIALSVAVFSVFFGLIGRDAQIAALNAEIYEINAAIADADAEYETLRLKIANYEDINWIMKEAGESLHMGYPAEENIYRIALPAVPGEQAAESEALAAAQEGEEASAAEQQQAEKSGLFTFFADLIGLLD